jgi:hypothetical protein
VIGTQHARQGDACEDALGSFVLPDAKSFVCAVADGAGSAPAGKEGAQTVVAAALARATRIMISSDTAPSRDFYLEALRQILQAARTALENAVIAPHTLNDFATTLLVTLVTPHWLAALQVGDGAIVVRHHDDTLETLTLPGVEEYLNETHFVTDEDYHTRAHYAVTHAEDIEGIALLTDGLQMLALEISQHQAYAPFFLPLFSFASQPKSDEELTGELHAFLTSDRVSRQADDDKTLLLAAMITQITEEDGV